MNAQALNDGPDFSQSVPGDLRHRDSEAGRAMACSNALGKIYPLQSCSDVPLEKNKLDAWPHSSSVELLDSCVPNTVQD